MSVTSATVNANAQIHIPKSFGNFASALDLVLNFAAPASLASGSGAAQFAHCYITSASIVSGSPLVIDVTGSLVEPDGTTFVVTDIVAILVKNNGTTGQIITMGGGSNPVVSFVSANAIIPPGATMIFFNPAASGYAVNASTAHTLQFANASGTAVVDIAILGH